MGAIVCQALQNQNIEAFLSGGAVVSIYTHNKYESFDLDFVSFGKRKKIKDIMEKLGFEQNTSQFYIHPKSKYYVEFPGTSMAIGDQPISEFSEKRFGSSVLRLLTPTDCIKDRMAAYIHWKDKQGLEQAVMVAQAQEFNSKKVEEFCRLEGAPQAFKEFIENVKRK